MRLARGFDPIGPDEQDDFPFDFGALLCGAGVAAETIASTVWAYTVSAGNACLAGALPKTEEE